MTHAKYPRWLYGANDAKVLVHHHDEIPPGTWYSSPAFVDGKSEPPVIVIKPHKAKTKE